jgi:hypothetical protein
VEEIVLNVMRVESFFFMRHSLNRTTFSLYYFFHRHGSGNTCDIMDDIGLDLCKAMVAFDEGDYSTTEIPLCGLYNRVDEL